MKLHTSLAYLIQRSDDLLHRKHTEIRAKFQFLFDLSARFLHLPLYDRLKQFGSDLPHRAAAWCRNRVGSDYGFDGRWIGLNDPDVAFEFKLRFM